MENDPLENLRKELPGIRGVITRYERGGLIGNYLDNLEKAIASGSRSETSYWLEKVRDWVDENAQDMYDNDFFSKKREISGVRQMVRGFAEELKNYDIVNLQGLADQKETSEPVGRNRDAKDGVFIVYGHDGEAKNEVARVLGKLGVRTVIFDEMPDGGKTIIEKLEDFTSRVKYAVILYTGCDIGREKGKPEEENAPRARQNVVFEHGLLTGILGRGNVCALVKGEVEKPSDIDGLVYILMDSQKGWQLELARELKNAGFNIDLNKLT